jgi:hypothetical protein
VHSQLSQKVQLLQALAQGQAGAGGLPDARAAAAVAAAAAALAEAGTRAAEEVGVAAAAGAAAGGDAAPLLAAGLGGGRRPGGTEGAQDDAIQHHLVRRMETIHTQLRSLCREMLAGALQEGGRSEAGAAAAASSADGSDGPASRGGSARGSGLVSGAGGGATPRCEPSWGSASCEGVAAAGHV